MWRGVGAAVVTAWPNLKRFSGSSLPEESSALRRASCPDGAGELSGGLAAGNGVAEAFEKPFDSCHPLPDVRNARFQGP